MGTYARSVGPITSVMNVTFEAEGSITKGNLVKLGTQQYMATVEDTANDVKCIGVSLKTVTTGQNQGRRYGGSSVATKRPSSKWLGRNPVAGSCVTLGILFPRFADGVATPPGVAAISTPIGAVDRLRYWCRSGSKKLNETAGTCRWPLD